MSELPPPEPGRSIQPGVPEPTAAERQAVVDRIQQALADDLILFDDLDDRFADVFGADSAAELERVVSDLPAVTRQPPAPPDRHPAPRSRFGLLGDVHVGGWIALESEMTVTSVIGDITIDLSSARIGPEGVTIKVRSLIGDSRVIVPDGAQVQVDGLQVLGDRRESLSPPVDGGPLIRISGLHAVGDLRVYSLSLVPEGALRKLWSKLRSLAAST